jgi:hypothetical protein
MSERVEVTVKIVGPKEVLEMFRERAKGEMPRYADELNIPDDPEAQAWHNQPLCFNKFLPVPEPLRNRTRWGYMEAKEVPQSGPLSYTPGPATSGGAWEEVNWGCKYGALCCSEGVIDDGILTYHFETRNALPCAAFIGISAQYPTLEISVYWEAEWAWDEYNLFVYRDGECVLREVLGDNPVHSNVWVGNKLSALQPWDEVRAEVNGTPTSDSSKKDLPTARHRENQQ